MQQKGDGPDCGWCRDVMMRGCGGGHCGVGIFFFLSQSVCPRGSVMFQVFSLFFSRSFGGGGFFFVDFAFQSHNAKVAKA